MSSKMSIHEVNLCDLSSLRSRTYICEFGGEHNPEALIFEFSGRYGIGSGGNDAAAYMGAVKSAWLAVRHVHALVFDLRQLEYEWGNAIWSVFRWGYDDSSLQLQEDGPKAVFPTALVISDLCRKGFSTCRGMVPPMFDDLEQALKFVEVPARKYLTDLFIWLDSDRS
jgi:hypothetical protein